MKKVRKDRDFRERAFRGAKIEDLIFHFKKLGEELLLKAESVNDETAEVYRAQALVYSNTVSQMVKEFQYDVDKLREEGQLKLFA